MRYVLVGLIAFGSVNCLGVSAWADSPPAAIQTESQVVGQSFPSLKLTNQHDALVPLPGDANVIVFTDAKAVDEWVNPVLAAFGQKQMDARHLVYLSDIHRMPWMIGKMIALPKLRERAYSVALIREASEPPVLAEPDKGCLNWIQLNSGEIESIDPVCSAAAFKTKLAAMASQYRLGTN